MRVERDTAYFALPFAAGTGLIAFIPAFHNHSSAPVLAVVSACMVTLMHPNHKSLNNRLLYIIISILALCCGALTSLTDKITLTGLNAMPQFMAAPLQNFNSSLKDIIISLPFHNKEVNYLITALITGGRGLLPDTLISAFRDSGASHILALSGFHLGIIYGILKYMTSPAGNSHSIKVTRSILIILLCGFYTAATGAGPSIARAFLFILLGETASWAGRHRDSGQLLCSAIVIQLMISPESIKDVGFQLSYAAMAGIAWIYPFLNRFWPDADNGIVYKILKRSWSCAAVSIACQITTAPLAWAYFGTFPKYFLLTNLIALPLTATCIPAALLTILLFSLGICPDMLIYLTEQLTGSLILSLKLISSF